MNREKIRKLYNKAKGLLEDQRPSQQVGPIGSPIFVVPISPRAIKEARELPVKVVFMDTMMDLLRESPVSQGLISHLLDRASLLFDNNLPSNHVLGFTVGLIDQGEWGLFDQAAQPEYERGVLSATVRALYLAMIGTEGILLGDEEAVRLSTIDCRILFIRVFTRDGAYPWPTVSQLANYFEREGYFISIPWKDYFKRSKELLNWFEQFRSHWSEPEAFKEEEPVLRQLAEYHDSFGG